MPEKSSAEVYNEDVAQILRALGLSDHARPVSAHEVVQTEILPRIEELLRTFSRTADTLDLIADGLDTRKLDGVIRNLRATADTSAQPRTP